jgi:(E)-4-hydroxy-3-methylbut-2-enyl-diphosphate synthase
MAKIKSAIGIGGLLLDGIGDTIRVSITGDPMAEIPVAMDILKAVGKLAGAVNIISCPTCGRCRVNLPEIVKSFQEKARAFEMDRIKQARRLQKIGRTSEAKKSINVAIMGCAVNGPGEARHADIGMAAGDSNAVLFRRGEILKNADVDIIMDELFDLLRRE